MSNVKSNSLHIVLCVAVVLVFGTVSRAQNNEMIPLTIDTAGHVEDIPFDLDKPSAVSIQAFFPPAELGKIKFAVTNESGQAVNIASPKILAPGSYSVAVSASGASPESFSVKIGVAEPLDSYEPNDTRETASPIELPLRTVIRTDSGRDNLDWFKFRIGQAYVLSIHIIPRSGGTVNFRVIDADGKDVYKAASTRTSRGARYVSLVAGEYYLTFGAAGGSVNTELELGLFDPTSGGGAEGGFIAVGMKEGSDALGQLKLIAKTTGKGLVESVDPEVMKAELMEAVREHSGETAGTWGLGWIIWVTVPLLVFGVAGFWLRCRFRQHDNAQTAEASTTSGDQAD
ncbi:MAG: hypothetical protein GY794_09250 [bacterium]|nr:hypothetical protein [bacterium]